MTSRISGNEGTTAAEAHGFDLLPLEQFGHVIDNDLLDASHGQVSVSGGGHSA